MVMMSEISKSLMLSPIKRYKKIPVYVVEEHNDALQFIYSAIGGKKLPVEGTVLLHLDAHPDMLIDRKLKGEEARSGRKLLPLLQIENWIVPAAAAGHIARVVWLRPPWAKQFSDGIRHFHIGDHPDSGLLRVDSKEPYYLSDALFSARLVNERTLTLTVEELSSEVSKEDKMKSLLTKIDITEPYVLDIDLDFFSTGNPFLGLYEKINLYDRLLPIFDFRLPESDDVERLEKLVESREQQLEELEILFEHLHKYNSLDMYTGQKSRLYNMVQELSTLVLAEAERLNEIPDWWAVYAGGCTRDQEGLPHHISTKEEIDRMVNEALTPLLQSLPAPVLITIARSTDDGYCPPDQVDYIQSLVLESVKKVYDTDEPALYYLNVNTNT